FASSLEYLQESAAGQGGHFHCSFIGVNLGESLVCVELIALVFHPARDLSLCHRRRQLGHQKFLSHIFEIINYFTLSFSVSSTFFHSSSAAWIAQTSSTSSFSRATASRSSVIYCGMKNQPFGSG